MLSGGREALATSRVETGGAGPFAAMLEVAIAPTPLTSATPSRKAAALDNATPLLEPNPGSAAKGVAPPLRLPRLGLR